MSCREAGGKGEDDEELFPVGSREDPLDWAASKPQAEWEGPTAADWRAQSAAEEALALGRQATPEVLPDLPAAAARPAPPRSMPYVFFCRPRQHIFGACILMSLCTSADHQQQHAPPIVIDAPLASTLQHAVQFLSQKLLASISVLLASACAKLS